MSARTRLILAAASAAVIVASGIPADATAATAPDTAPQAIVNLCPEDTSSSAEAVRSSYSHLMALQLQLRRLTGRSGLHLATGFGGEGGQVLGR